MDGDRAIAVVVEPNRVEDLGSLGSRCGGSVGVGVIGVVSRIEGKQNLTNKSGRVTFGRHTRLFGLVCQV